MELALPRRGSLDALLDTNILIGVLNGTLDAATVTKRGVVGISVITVMELLALSGMSSQEERLIQSSLAQLITIPVSERIAQRAGVLAKTRSLKKKPDLLIAATALEMGVPLLTNNLKDFRSIPGITLIQL